MKLHEFKIAYVVAAWVVIAVVIIKSLYLWNSSGFSTNLDLLSKVITFVLAPLAVLSAWVSFAQCKVQSDREAGYEDDLNLPGELEGDESNQRELEEEEGPEEEVEPEEEEKPEEALTDKPQSLTIFQTRKQVTTLRITSVGIECYIDDFRPGRGGRQWTMRRREVSHSRRYSERDSCDPVQE